MVYCVNKFFEYEMRVKSFGNTQSPSRLLDLAGTSLLRGKASAISALEFLPTELFSPLFRKAFDRRCIQDLSDIFHGIAKIFSFFQHKCMGARFEGLWP